MVPLTVSVNADPPTVAFDGDTEVIVGTGLLTGNVQVPEVPPPGAGLVTVTFAVVATPRSLEGIWAVIFVELTKVVASGVPFQLTTELSTKFVPVTAKVIAPEPASTLTGASAVMVGTGMVLVTVKVMAPEAPPPGAGLVTVMLAVPAVARSAAGIDVASSVALT